MNNTKSSITELERVGNPYKHNSMSRTAYYTNIRFEIGRKRILLPMRIDTGAAYTVIGTHNTQIERWRDIINNSIMTGTAFDASGIEINLKGYIVNNFKLTQDIVFPKIRVFFSDALGDRALLGMDILSLFDFQYKHEKGNMLGTFWINNWEHYMKKIFDILEKKHLKYLDTEQIFLLDETEEQFNNRVNLQELEANLIHNKLTEKK